MQCSKGRLLSRQRERGGWTTFRRSWATPGLQPHQQIDMEITRRQITDRKALNRSRTPFANYYRAEFRRSPAGLRAAVRPNGLVSSFDAARLMTDPRRSWYTPWSGRARDAAYAYKRGRQDIVQPVVPSFGADAADAVLVRLMQERFAWDKEDGLVAPQLVPRALHAASVHCAPYATQTQLTHKDHHGRHVTTSHATRQHTYEDEEEDCVVIDGVTVTLRNPRQQRTTISKRSNLHAASGVESIPTVVLDALRGPLLVAPHAATLTLRWQAEVRNAESVQAVVQLRRRLAALSAIALPARSLALLVKAVASAEMEEPALDVALVIAVAEQYNEYSPVASLELLRCLRRIALVRGLSAIPTHSTSASRTEASAPLVQKGLDIPLYTEARHMQCVLHRFVSSAGLQLMTKVWARLPEQCTHFVRHRAALDWIDLLGLAVELSGCDALPRHLPNAASHDDYAAKYLFFRYTLQMDETVMHMLVQQLRHNKEKDEEDVETTRVVWLCAALLVRLVAESVGELLAYVGTALQEAVQRVLSNAMQCGPEKYKESTAMDTTHRSVIRSVVPLPLLRLKSPAIRAFERIGQRRPRLVRLRLIPYEAFPHVMRCLPPPCLDITRRVQRTLESEKDRYPVSQSSSHSDDRDAVAVRDTQDTTDTDAAERCLKAPCVHLLAHSATTLKQVKRVCGALKWATLVLRHVCELVQGLPLPQGSSNIHNTSANDAVVVQRRQELCYAYVRSRVQDELDALFTFVPWHDVEAELQPMLEYHVTQDTEACDNDTVNSERSHEERQATEMLRHMHECVDDFQLAVGDVLGAHEAAFPELYNDNNEEELEHTA